jgi:flagellar biosynthesis/type III secretory pathway chaperone
MKPDFRIAAVRGSAGITEKFPEMAASAYFPPPAGERERQSPHASGAQEPVMIALSGALARLEDVIGEETAALEARQSIDLQDFNRRKSRSLLELTRIIRSLPPKIMDEELRRRIERLRHSLVRNKELLRIHLTAAQEIAEVLANAIGDAESDGTYGRTTKPAGRG